MSKVAPKLTSVWVAWHGIKTNHLERLGGLSPKWYQNATKTDHLERLGGLAPKWSKMVPKLFNWSA